MLMDIPTDSLHAGVITGIQPFSVLTIYSFQQQLLHEVSRSLVQKDGILKASKVLQMLKKNLCSVHPLTLTFREAKPALVLQICIPPCTLFAFTPSTSKLKMQTFRSIVSCGNKLRFFFYFARTHSLFNLLKAACCESH